MWTAPPSGTGAVAFRWVGSTWGKHGAGVSNSEARSFKPMHLPFCMGLLLPLSTYALDGPTISFLHVCTGWAYYFLSPRMHWMGLLFPLSTYALDGLTISSLNVCTWWAYYFLSPRMHWMGLLFPLSTYALDGPISSLHVCTGWAYFLSPRICMDLSPRMHWMGLLFSICTRWTILFSLSVYALDESSLHVCTCYYENEGEPWSSEIAEQRALGHTVCWCGACCCRWVP